MQEFRLLEHVYAANLALGGEVVVPPGDDLGQIRLAGRDLLAGVDQLVAGRHYDPAVTPIDLVGRKAVTRSLSDVAAMCARPCGALVAVTLPPDFGEPSSRRLFDAMRRTAEAYACPLIGGDISVHGDAAHPLVCAVTVLAEPTTRRPITRGGAAPGDGLYVTGSLGATRGADGLGHHLTFEPRLPEAAALADALGECLHAMIDISDGLGRDAGHIAERSSVVIEIDARAVPVRGGGDWRAALGDGEDYELCFAASGAVPAEILGVAITRVGRVAEAGTARVDVRDGDERYDGRVFGWQHES